MKTTKLNNIKVNPVIVNDIDPKRISGFKMQPTLYSNTAILGKKFSGKTSLLYNMLKNMVNKKTTIFLFSPTVSLDATYKIIIDMLEEKGATVYTYESLVEGKTNILSDIMDELKEQYENDNKDKKDEKGEVIHVRRPCFGDELKEEEEEKKAKRKPRKLFPDNIFVLDDNGNAMRNKVGQLLRTNRHFKSKTFLIGHNLTDLDPGMRKNLDYVYVFKCCSEEKLKMLYNDLDLSCEFNDFQKAYDYATSEPFNFLYIDVRNDAFRKNFSELIEL